jgi:TonB family protein
MSELFGVFANRRRLGGPAAISGALHAGVVVLAIVLAPMATLTKVHANARVIPLYMPTGAFPVDTPHTRSSSRASSDAIAIAFPAASKSVPFQARDVQVGALDHLTAAARPALGSAGSAEVLVGRLGGGTAGKGPESIGTVGPTDTFTPSGPARKQAPLLAPHADEESAQLLSAPAPSYNEEARRLNVTGEVVVEVKLTASGEVHVLRVLSGLGHGLDQSAIEAVNQIRCRPALKAGRPVDVIANIRVAFKLT